MCMLMLSPVLQLLYFNFCLREQNNKSIVLIAHLSEQCTVSRRFPPENGAFLHSPGLQKGSEISKFIFSISKRPKTVYMCESKGCQLNPGISKGGKNKADRQKGKH